MTRLLLALLLLSACGRRDRIVIGAKNFTESDLLAEIVAQQIERRTALPVERKLHLGGTFVCHQAITAGAIDLYVEYTGTAFTAILKQPPIADPDSVYRFVARDYARRFQLRWTAPLGFNNTFAILVRRADAERYGLRSIGDLARVASRWKAGFGYEFLERADGFAGLAKLYGLAFSRPPTAMDLGLTYRALADHGVDVIAGNSTDGQIAALDLVALADDRGYFPPYQAAPVVRETVLEKYPAVQAALAELGGKISDAEMRRLNALADVEHRDIAEIVVRGGAQGFVQEISAGRHRLVADEPVAAGGTDRGPGPYDLLMSALGSCMSMTIALYARTKKWPLETVTIRLTHSRVYAKDCLDCVVRDDTLLDRIDTAVQLSGPLTVEQEQKLMEVAHKCPVHRTLKSQIEIREVS